MRFCAVWLLMAALAFCSGQSLNYDVYVVSTDPVPVVSYMNGTSDYQEVFNAAFVTPSAGTSGKSGLLG
jgi:hypothetical protein